MARAWVMLFLLSGCAYFTPPETPPRDAGDAGATLNGCAPGAFVDRRSPSAPRVVAFGGEAGSPPIRFEPACMTVARGQSVTFTGAFTRHPLAPGVMTGPAEAASPGNPIPSTGDGSAVTVAFPAAGLFPFFCRVHGGAGMAGVVRVE